ncbi:nicotinate-nucleotide--dimethylbenzimidazole phosphoribosyltransferase [Actomonas aquatica]|uniref:Nicotinate-nucleotide--dimethylbenzimidazole phosphoribosyltransferase n=1 Tax=Actomonas aquatica TaxID=2866162 RepID=A0ABZ1CDN8_9BACT|nr:nicotinate-nucleotide--dimethylbenzimidazole phosphoribosyltransferase [Opitutus sp. WL0086]WRQ89721.1 nicotinate-nucleotide--dimethylbenzimidazole phosphoribosyltransferase [Opitutus sp. WL0086]
MNWNTPEIPPLAKELEPVLRASIDGRTKPIGSLGRLEALALQLGLMQATVEPKLAGAAFVVAGDHGFAEDGVSPCPQAVTVQMVLNFLAGGAGINVFARQMGLPLKVVDAGVAAPLPAHPDLVPLSIRAGTRNARLERAMTMDEVDAALSGGESLVAQIAAEGKNAVIFGEMGIGNTASASLLMSALTGTPIAACTGRGAGHDDAGLAHKISILEAVVERHADVWAKPEPLDVLAAVGGLEIAVIVGGMLAAAERRMLIVNDGFIITAALLVAARLNPRVLDYTVFAHGSAEQAHAQLVAELGGKPLLDLGLRLGEGTGAALAWPLLEASVNFLAQMATFESAGVTVPTAP